jgi:predicted PurR-regulated permease PerM
MNSPSRTTIDLSSGTLFRVVVFVVGLWFLWFIRDILLLLIVSVLIASALEPMVKWLQRFRIPRALSVLLVYLVCVGVIGGIGTALVPPLIAEVRSLARELPDAYSRLEELLGGAGVFLGTPAALSSLQEGLVSLGNFLARSSGGFFATTRSVFGSVFMVILTLVISFYIVVSRNSLVLFVRSLVPLQHQSYALNLVERAQEKIGRWVIAQMLLGIIIGAVTFVGLWSLGIPYALALALLAGFLEIIPALGPILAGIPAVLLGFTQSLLMGVLVLILYIVVQQLENHLLVPNIMRRAVGLNPLATILAVLVGAKLAGFLGILLAVPVATILGVFFGDFIPAGKDGEELPA